MRSPRRRRFRLRHDHDAQEPARPARRHDPVQGEVRQADRQVGLPRHAGRPHEPGLRHGHRARQGVAARLQGILQAHALERQDPGHNPGRAAARLITGGTDDHMMVVDCVKGFDITGKVAEEALDEVSITCNKQMIPDDPNPRYAPAASPPSAPRGDHTRLRRCGDEEARRLDARRAEERSGRSCQTRTSRAKSKTSAPASPSGIDIKGAQAELLDL
ncbi:MAG: hypothetical protein R2724_07150 [Bryobacterales bacterium]